MTERITIPAACLQMLGGLMDGDPPVLRRFEAPFFSGHTSSHPLQTIDSKAYGSLLVTQSAPALLRVLARYLKFEMLEGDTPQWLQSDGAYRMTTLSVGRGAWECAWFGYDPEHPDDYFHHIPTITPDMSRMRALAEATVWLARVARAGPACGQHPDGGCNDKWCPTGLSEYEAANSLPTWSVAQ